MSYSVCRYGGKMCDGCMVWKDRPHRHYDEEEYVEYIEDKEKEEEEEYEEEEEE